LLKNLASHEEVQCPNPEDVQVASLEELRGYLQMKCATLEQ